MLHLRTTNATSKPARRAGTPNKILPAPCVLLVDDDRAVRALLATSLEYFGCRTLTAGNGEEALQVLHAKPFVDVMVTEVPPPVMGGLELLRTVRQIDGFKTLPVILCSVFIDEATMKKALEYRCGRYLLKPVYPEFLFEQISSLLQQKVSRRDMPLAQA